MSLDTGSEVMRCPGNEVSLSAKLLLPDVKSIVIRDQGGHPLEIYIISTPVAGQVAGGEYQPATRLYYAELYLFGIAVRDGVYVYTECIQIPNVTESHRSPLGTQIPIHIPLRPFEGFRNTFESLGDIFPYYFEISEQY